MKRTLLLILCLLLVMTFAACGEDTTPTPTDGPTDGPTDAPTEPPTDAPTEPPTDAPTDPPHEHSYTLTLSVDANCDGEGQKVYSCQCGDTYTETFPKTAHTFGDWYVATRPTMTETGTEARECGTCGHKETKTLAVLTTEEFIKSYAELVCCMPTFHSADELYAGGFMDWILLNVDTISNEWNEETFLSTRVYSLDEIDRVMNYYFGKTFDFIYLTQHDEYLTYDQQNNTLIWQLGGMGGWPNYVAETVTKIDDTHYTLRYAGIDLGETQPFCYGTLTLELVEGRFVILSNVED